MDEIASPAGARVEPQAHEVAGQNVGGPELGVSVAILQAGKLLLTQREDYEIWCLPGGGVELGETLVQAAMRETYEEVGLEVKLTRLVGVYSDPSWFNHGLHVVLFAAQVTGGKLAPQAGEVLAARFFGLDELPEALMFGTRQRAEHALQGVGGGVAWTQYSPRPLLPPLTRQEIYAMRDLSGLSRAEFYRRNFGDFDPGSETLEVGPHDAKNH
jgi:ADP-ribose pyrophosphatase YjhB (NUDIX family)